MPPPLPILKIPSIQYVFASYRGANKPSHYSNGEGKIHLTKVNRNTFAKLAKVIFWSKSFSCQTNIFTNKIPNLDFSSRLRRPIDWLQEIMENQEFQNLVLKSGKIRRIPWNFITNLGKKIKIFLLVIYYFYDLSKKKNARIFGARILQRFIKHFGWCRRLSDINLI